MTCQLSDTKINKILETIYNGDKDKIDTLLKLIQPTLKKFIRQRTKNRADSDDILQETLISISESLNIWSGRGRFISFCYAIANHEIADYYHKEKLHHLVKLANQVVISRVKETLDRKIGLKQLLAFLPFDYRLVLELKYFYGFSVKEIASFKKTSPKAIESLLWRARKKSRCFLEKKEII